MPFQFFEKAFCIYNQIKNRCQNFAQDINVFEFAKFLNENALFLTKFNFANKVFLYLTKIPRNTKKQVQAL